MKIISNQSDLFTSSSLTYLNNCFNNYGLKYLFLIILLITYQFIGAIIFYVCEASNDRQIEYLWKLSLTENRTRLILEILRKIPKQQNLTEINNVFFFHLKKNFFS